MLLVIFCIMALHFLQWNHDLHGEGISLFPSYFKDLCLTKHSCDLHSNGLSLISSASLAKNFARMFVPAAKGFKASMAPSI